MPFRMSGLEDELLELGGDITTALEDVPLPATLLDQDGVIRWQNGASIALRGDNRGADFVGLVAPNEQAAARDVITRILCCGEPAELTLSVSSVEGGYTPVQLSAAPVRGGGSVVAVFGLGWRQAPQGRRAAPLRDGGLTPRQLEILHLLANGSSTAEMASQLHLSPTTVRNHVANILAALGVHTRLQAVVAASRAGLLSD